MTVARVARAAAAGIHAASAATRAARSIAVVAPLRPAASPYSPVSFQPSAWSCARRFYASESDRAVDAEDAKARIDEAGEQIGTPTGQQQASLRESEPDDHGADNINDAGKRAYNNARSSVVRTVGGAAGYVGNAVSNAASRVGLGARNVFADQTPPPPSKTVYLGNLYFGLREQELNEYVASYNPSQEAADAALELDGQMLSGRPLLARYGKARSPFGRESQSPQSPSSCLYVGNMSFDMTDKDFVELFEGIQGITDVRVAIDRRTGQPRGFAHCDFNDVKAAEAGLEALSQRSPYGRALRINYALKRT